MWNFFEYLLGEEFSEMQLALFVAGRAQSLSFTGERNQKIMPAVTASDTGEAVIKDAALKIAVR
jgi:hypothetical protein